MYTILFCYYTANIYSEIIHLKIIYILKWALWKNNLQITLNGYTI